MKDLFSELIKRYEEKINFLHMDLNPNQPWWKEIYSPSETALAEDVIEKELQFYQEFDQEIESLQKLRGKKIEIKEWNEIVIFLKIHNERLSSQIDLASTISNVFAAVSAIAAILALNVGPQNWIIFIMVTYVAFQNFNSRIKKRKELSRNKEIQALIEHHVSKKA